MLKRVVVTGVGLVSPLGCGTEGLWTKLNAGARGIRPLKSVDDETIECGSWTSDKTAPRSAAIKVAACVPRVQDPALLEAPFDGVAGFDAMKGASRDKSLFIQYALHASDLALAHAGLQSHRHKSEGEGEDSNEQLLGGCYPRERVGVAIASGIGAINETVEGSAALDVSEKKLSPFFVPKILINMAAGQVSLRHGLKGPNHSVATACAAGAHAIGDAYNFIRLGYADAMLCGGSEACIGSLAVAGFGRMRALSTSACPRSASRPFHPDRDGFVIGEGSAVLVLEELSMAQARGATIIAELVGYGLSGDAHHATSPSPVGDGAERAMRGALEGAHARDPHFRKEHVGYVNAHATSTPTGDGIELRAIAAVFAPDQNQDHDGRMESRSAPLYVSSTKGATGHMLGAAGAFEGAVAALAARDGLLPPCLGLTGLHPSELGLGAECDHMQLVRAIFTALYTTGVSIMILTPVLTLHRH
jgi:3-oxoacyl-[acyl-carrier-protein] synthase II